LLTGVTVVAGQHTGKTGQLVVAVAAFEHDLPYEIRLDGGECQILAEREVVLINGQDLKFGTEKHKRIRANSKMLVKANSVIAAFKRGNNKPDRHAMVRKATNKWLANTDSVQGEANKIASTKATHFRQLAKLAVRIQQNEHIQELYDAPPYQRRCFVLAMLVLVIPGGIALSWLFMFACRASCYHHKTAADPNFGLTCFARTYWLSLIPPIVVVLIAVTTYFARITFVDVARSAVRRASHVTPQVRRETKAGANAGERLEHYEELPMMSSEGGGGAHAPLVEEASPAAGAAITSAKKQPQLPQLPREEVRAGHAVDGDEALKQLTEREMWERENWNAVHEGGARGAEAVSEAVEGGASDGGAVDGGAVDAAVDANDTAAATTATATTATTAATANADGTRRSSLTHNTEHAWHTAQHTAQAVGTTVMAAEAAVEQSAVQFQRRVRVVLLSELSVASSVVWFLFVFFLQTIISYPGIAIADTVYYHIATTPLSDLAGTLGDGVYVEGNSAAPNSTAVAATSGDDSSSSTQADIVALYGSRVRVAIEYATSAEGMCLQWDSAECVRYGHVCVAPVAYASDFASSRNAYVWMEEQQGSSSSSSSSEYYGRVWNLRPPPTTPITAWAVCHTVGRCVVTDGVDGGQYWGGGHGRGIAGEVATRDGDAIDFFAGDCYSKWAASCTNPVSSGLLRRLGNFNFILNTEGGAVDEGGTDGGGTVQEGALPGSDEYGYAAAIRMAVEEGVTSAEGAMVVEWNTPFARDEYESFKMRVLRLVLAYAVVVPTAIWLIYLSTLTHEWGEAGAPTWAKHVHTHAWGLWALVCVVLTITRTALFQGV
jgi:hypothetical protein